MTKARKCTAKDWGKPWGIQPIVYSEEEQERYLSRLRSMISSAFGVPPELFGQDKLKSTKQGNMKQSFLITIDTDEHTELDVIRAVLEANREVARTLNTSVTTKHVKEPIKSTLEQVREFHETFKHNIEAYPAIPEQNRINLRIALIGEEFQELQDAIADKDLVEVLDALLDIEYVLMGTVLEFGLQDLFFEGFEEVHRSNMSKVWPDGVPHYSENGKVIKPDTYSPANLKQFLDEWDTRVLAKRGTDGRRQTT